MTLPLIEALRTEVIDALMACADTPLDEQQINALSDIYVELARLPHARVGGDAGGGGPASPAAEGGGVMTTVRLGQLGLAAEFVTILTGRRGWIVDYERIRGSRQDFDQPLCRPGGALRQPDGYVVVQFGGQELRLHPQVLVEVRP